ncbi:MAG: hypothetical protein NTW82_06160 [Bacteroidia bacterium]|nr:hypothetical protein [Bacteroidia bacterium]
MDFNATVDLILKDLNEAREIIDDLKNYPGVPELQVELAKSKCKSAGDVIALLKKRKPYEEVSSKPETPRTAPVIEEKVSDNIPDKPAGSAILADTFGLTDGINEKMGSMRADDNVSEIMKAKPLSNLADAIGVNDKFLFIRELFKGSPESYNQAIANLDRAVSFTEAREVLRRLTGDKKETEVAKQLLEMVKRKFPFDE